MLYVVCNVCTVHSASLTYNAALNKPAYQSSVYTDYRGSYSADLANDGSRETNAVKDDKAQCVHSTPETNPWWAVDLGGPTTIYRVDFTNRGDYGGVCLFVSFGVPRGLVIAQFCSL